MSAKSYLNRARALKLTIRALERKRQEFEALKTAISSPMRDSDPVQTSKSGEAPYARTVEKLIDIDESLALRVGEYADTLAEMEAEIGRLENPVYVEVLTRRYLDFQRYERIAVDMHYSFDYVKNLHGKALRAFEEKYPEKFIK